MQQVNAKISIQILSTSEDF